MEYKIRLLIFIIILIIEILLDKSLYNKCKNIKGKLLLIIHHMIGIYIWIGSLLFGNHLIHFIFVLVAIILFIINNGCFLTDWTNEICEFDKNMLFKSWINIIFGNKNAKSIYIFLINIIILYDLYYINKRYKFIKL